MGQGVDYFWIGGTGNWSDSLHWSSENGGLPAQYDNVFFNANSFTTEFQTVTIDVEAECFNMDWSNIDTKPILTGSKDLHIYSSLTLSPEMDVSFDGNLHFEGDNSELYIICAGNSLNSNIYFNGSGNWSVIDPMDLGLKNVYLNNGNLNTQGNSIYCGSFFSIGTNTKTLILNSSEIRIQGNNGRWEVNNGLNLIKGNSVIEFADNGITSSNVFDGGNLSYGNVIFRNSGSILGNNTFENVYFSANRNYELQGNKTQTINGGLFARGCSGLIEIFAGQNGIANILHNGGDINISFVSLKSINAMSGSGYNFNAWHSIDEGNNSGCNISPDSREMYWINNTGNWSDTTHWMSSISGEDADCVPILHDNVNFNNDSFNENDTVIVDIDDIKCHNMTWAGNQNPVFKNSINDAKLTVNGSLEFSNTMQNLFGGIMVFNDTLGGKMIKTSNKIFNNDLLFEGNNGGWSIMDSLLVEGSIYFMRGNLTSNDNYIGCYTFHSDSAFDRSINLGNSYIKLSKNTPTYAWSLNNENLELDPGKSTIELEYSSGVFNNYGGDTIEFNNILFSEEIGLARLNTHSDIYAKFHKVDFKSNGLISASNSFDTLSFSPGNYYQLNNGHTQTINDEISPSGDCFGPIVLQSFKNGAQAVIYKQSDTLHLINTAIRDIAVNGGATFIAEHSVDLGNNNGWDTIQVSSPGNLYWVGGSGEWSDPDHWSLTSGGAGGECVPTPYDTVIFDQGSFSENGQFVNIDLNNALAHNMDWSSAAFNPEFSGNNTSANLRIFGSLELNTEMNFTYRGQLFFEANNTGQTIITNGIKFLNSNNNITFDGIGGEWTLIDSLSLGHELANKNAINFNNGELNTNGQFVKCYNFSSRYNNPRILSLDTSIICICNEWYMRGDNLLLTENNSIIRLDSGHFFHYYGNSLFYHDILLSSDNDYQKVVISNADSIFFNDIRYINEGEISGLNSVVYADKIHFQDNGFINTDNLGSENVFIIDTLIFNSTGHVFGNDTVKKYLKFGSIGVYCWQWLLPKFSIN